jgi:hypothetical protein
MSGTGPVIGAPFVTFLDVDLAVDTADGSRRVLVWLGVQDKDGEPRASKMVMTPEGAREMIAALAQKLDLDEDFDES